jgi:hypothetical protein
VTAAELLVRAIADGLSVALEGEHIVVRPTAKIGDELRQAFVEQRQAVVAELAAATSMPGMLAPIPPRPCRDCEHLHGAYCLHYQAVLLEPLRPCRCGRVEQRAPELPWT